MSVVSDEILAWLDYQNISYTLFEHEAVYTFPEAERVTGHLGGVGAKTLLVKTQKSQGLYLLSVVGDKKLEQGRVKALLGERVTFVGVETLEKVLRVTPGSVSPLGLIFDTTQAIQGYLIDEDLLSAERVNWHPNDNTMTVQLTQEAWEKVLSCLPHSQLVY